MQPENTKDIIVHSLPYNPEVCGGIKVHYQLAMLEQQLGYDVFMVYPGDDLPEISWFNHTCKEMTITSFNAYLTTSGRKVFLVIGYEDPISLTVVPAKHKVAYIQGHVYFKNGEYTYDTKLWYNSNYCKQFCRAEGELVSPYLSRTFTGAFNDMSPSFLDEENKKEKYKVLIQSRKDGAGTWEEVKSFLKPEVLEKLIITFHGDTDESAFAQAIYQSDILIAHSYPEGFGLPPLEAMALGTVVIGYTGGGGTDFMENNVNSLVARDGDTQELADHITDFVLNYSAKDIFDLKVNGKGTAIKYNAFSTFKTLRKILKGYHNENND